MNKHHTLLLTVFCISALHAGDEIELTTFSAQAQPHETRIDMSSVVENNERLKAMLSARSSHTFPHRASDPDYYFDTDSDSDSDCCCDNPDVLAASYYYGAWCCVGTIVGTILLIKHYT